MKAKTALFLYTELAGYMVNCINTLAEEKAVEVKIIAYPVNPEAPFNFDFHPRVEVLDRGNFEDDSLSAFIEKVQPDWIYCSGWSDKGYLKAVKKHAYIPSALAFDNQWEGSLKQKVLSIAARFLLRPRFNFAFVPGARQVQFAKKLGFTDKTIKQGVYCCDVDLFSSYKAKKSQKQLLWIGRYIPQKGADLLWKTFIEVNAKLGNEWTLHCAGTGIDFEQRVKDAHIVHHGFVQPEDLKELIQKSTCFVLPSHFEPWGVVAAAGLPILASSAVGAGDAFVQNGENGLIFQVNEEIALKEALSQVLSSDLEALEQMGLKSEALALKITPKTWADTVESMMYL
jgi:glycosyltransferase involved in cell wall biosynthesis